MAFDGIVTKAIASELQQLSGARIDKVFQPNKWRYKERKLEVVAKVNCR